MEIYDVLIKPILSEKNELMREKNIYAFKVDKRANKKQIKEAIYKLYKVNPQKVNILNKKPKPKGYRAQVGYKSSYKKAYIYLSPKDKIPIFEAS